MRDRLALRTPFGGVLTILAIAGWRPLHREVLLRMQEDASVRDRVRRLQDAMQSNEVGMFLLCADGRPP